MEGFFVSFLFFLVIASTEGKPSDIDMLVVSLPFLFYCAQIWSIASSATNKLSMPLWNMEKSSCISLVNIRLTIDPIGKLGISSVEFHFVCKLGYWSKGTLAYSGSVSLNKKVLKNIDRWSWRHLINCYQ